MQKPSPLAEYMGMTIVRSVPGAVLCFLFVGADTARPGTSVWSNYLGGTRMDAATAVAVDPAGNVYVAGWTESTDFPVVKAFQPHSGGGVDAWVAKLSPDRKTLIYSTYLGGSADDRASSIAVDAAGNVYVAGSTTSVDFPVLSAVSARNSGGRDAFVVKLGPTGSVAYSTYIGGADADSASAIAVDTSGNAYIAGSTQSSNFPISSAAQPTFRGVEDGFVLKLDEWGSVLFSTYVGGSLTDYASAIAVDSSGCAYITGLTESSDFPVKSAFQSASGGGADAFVTKLAANGASFVFSSYLGGPAGNFSDVLEYGTGIAVDAAGNVFVTGLTGAGFPAIGPYSSPRGFQDAFVAKVATAGTALQYAVYVGGKSSDYITSVSIGDSGQVWIGGYTSSTDFPVGAAQNPSYIGFLAAVGTYGTLTYQTAVSGGTAETISSVAFYKGNLYVAGQTRSVSLPSPGPVGTRFSGIVDGFLGVISPPTISSRGPVKVGVFQTGTWALDQNGNGVWDGVPADTYTSFTAGSGEIAVVGDWNGDGRSEIGVYRKGFWLLDYNGNGQWDGALDQFCAFGGNAGEVPILGDWSGDGRTKIGVYVNGFWLLDYNGNGRWDGATVDRMYAFGGAAGDLPVVGDWNGDGKTKIGLFRAGTFLLDANGNGTWDGPSGGDLSFTWGRTGDKPVVGDWNGDGRTKVGVNRLGFWILDVNGNGKWDDVPADAFIALGGNTGEIPIVGDWNGDGRDKVGFFVNGSWVLDYNGSGRWDDVTGGDRLIGLGGRAGEQPVLGRW